MLRKFTSIIKDIYRFNSFKTAASFILIVILGITNGINIAILVPMLESTGLGKGEHAKSQFSNYISGMFNTLGISPSFGVILFIFLIVFLLVSYLQYQQLKLASELSTHYSLYIRDRLYRNIFNAQWLFFVNQKMAHAANILTVESQRIMVLCNALIRVISEAFIVVIYIALALMISWQITIIVVAAGIVITWLMRRQIQSGRDIGVEMTNANNELQSVVWEHLGSAKIVKGYASENQSFSFFHKMVEKVSDLNIRYLVNQAKIRAIFEPVTVILLCIGLYVALNYFKIDTALLIVLLFIFYKLSPKITLIQQNYHKALTSIPAVSALQALEEKAVSFREQYENKAGINSFSKGIIFDNVSFSYNADGNKVLENINISIPYGKTIALVGESGAGKSTAADLIMGLLLPSEGGIHIDDQEINNINMADWRSLIGYVPQDTILFHESIRANLLWANPGATEEDIADVLKISAADSFVNSLPEGLDTITGDRGVRLSGGQRQRLALARALLRKPRLLILDEATSSLDAESERHIQEAVEALHGNITILIITHRLATVRNADFIYTMRNGEVVESGTWKELTKNLSGYFYSLCSLQGLVDQ